MINLLLRGHMNKRLFKRAILGSIVIAVAIPGGLVYRQYRHDMSLAYRRTSSGGKMIETACGPIQYTEFGQGAPMLIVHGAGGGYDQGEYFAKVIGGNYRWIAPSRFGFLGTPVPDGVDSSLQADAYACLLDALGIDRVGVLGVSMGGPSSLLFALHYPQRTTSLVMISAVSHAVPPRPAIIATLFNVFLNDFVFWSMVHVGPGGLLAALGVPPEVQQQLSPQEVAQLHAFLESIVPMGARRNGQLLEQHMSEYDAEQIQNIQAPTLVLHARDDTLVFFEQGEFTASHIPGAQLIPMEKGGHLALMLDMNAGAREKVLEFLQQYNSQ
jgi:pimeloyl-ACP methyl ester carboxylesterase